MEPALNPREIQNRIRRGESPEQVAEAAGMSVEKVRGFAVPVIAEREYIVEQARVTSVRRLHSTGSPGMQLGSLVDAALHAQGASAESAAWDSWRREDGRWTVIVAPEGAAEPVTFLFDVKGRYILPADDAAHALIGDVVHAEEHQAEETTEEVILPVTAPVAEAPQIVEQVESVEVHLDVEIDLPIDELLPKDDEVEYDLPVPEEVLERSAPVSSLKEARDRRALEQLALSVEAEVSAPVETADVEITEEQDLAVPATPHPSQRGSSKKRHERRRVPSWDEIMFGGTSRD